MPDDELALLLEQNYQRDLVARTMMFAVQNYELFDFSDPAVSVFFAFVDGILVDLTVTDYPDGRRRGHVNIKELGTTVLDAELNFFDKNERPSIAEYTTGDWEKRIPLPANWMVVSGTG